MIIVIFAISYIILLIMALDSGLLKHIPAKYRPYIAWAAIVLGLLLLVLGIIAAIIKINEKPVVEHIHDTIPKIVYKDAPSIIADSKPKNNTKVTANNNEGFQPIQAGGKNNTQTNLYKPTLIDSNSIHIDGNKLQELKNKIVEFQQHFQLFSDTIMLSYTSSGNKIAVSDIKKFLKKNNFILITGAVYEPPQPISGINIIREYSSFNQPINGSEIRLNIIIGNTDIGNTKNGVPIKVYGDYYSGMSMHSETIE